ncbi:hypothetical protein USDA257_c50910 [Sinorhizobium fredii USDA 257]|jgi:hypothetical protein|uniref:Uncharacterized protein n=1 Tax=Sinorhizobium fredii (strain USDA 257) TaxID=1185652 RepID=I3XCL1_SINF2|nr:hypothetical protein USDA257_c50910 [Sinorhizobium fredii USDA 257]
MSLPAAPSSLLAAALPVIVFESALPFQLMLARVAMSSCE